jgi:lipoate-protein ligase A
MRGDYKTVGGKLVTVNFDVQGGNLTNVQVSGDFFLYPEEALGAIRQALEGLPAASAEQALAQSVRAALGPEVTLVGFSPEAVAKAVGRGLGRDDQ